jgi:hypothetical protein
MNIVHRLSTGLVSLVMTLGLPALGLTAALVLWPGQAEAFNVNCGSNGVMVGISGRQGWWMDRVTPRCRSINSDGTLSSTISSGGSAGSNGGTAKGPFTCPQNHVVVGITGSASTSGTRRVLYVHELICLPWVPETRRPLQGTTITRAAFPVTNPIGVKGHYLAHSCQPGQVATGLSGSAGSYINSITGIGCRLAPGATAPAPVARRPAARVPVAGAQQPPAQPQPQPQPAGPAPDVQPVWNGTPLRHIAPVRKLRDSFCSGLSKEPTNRTSRMYINVPDVSWGVTNSGDADVTEPFEVRLEILSPGGGAVVVRREYLAGLNAGQTRFFTYQRPQSMTVVARIGTSLTTQERNTYNASGGECVQEWPQPESQYEWQDPGFRVSVDADGAIANESNRGNNSRTY